MLFLYLFAHLLQHWFSLFLPSSSWKFFPFSNIPPVPLSVCLYLSKKWKICIDVLQIQNGSPSKAFEDNLVKLFRQLIVQPTFIVIHLGYSHDWKSKITESGSKVGTKWNFLLIPTHGCTDLFNLLWIVFTFVLTISMAIKPKI